MMMAALEIQKHCLELASLYYLKRQQRLPSMDVAVPTPFLLNTPGLCLLIRTLFGLLLESMFPE